MKKHSSNGKYWKMTIDHSLLMKSSPPTLRSRGSSSAMSPGHRLFWSSAPFSSSSALAIHRKWGCMMPRFCSSSWRGWRSPPRRRRAAGLASSPQDAQGASPSESRRPESRPVVLSSQRSWLLVELERAPPPASQILWDEWRSLKKGCNNALKYNILLTCAGGTPQSLSPPQSTRMGENPAGRGHRWHWLIIGED